MAVERLEETAKLVLKVRTGADANGGAVYRQRSFMRLNPELTDADALAVGTALGALQAHPVERIVRQGGATLAERA